MFEEQTLADSFALSPLIDLTVKTVRAQRLCCIGSGFSFRFVSFLEHKIAHETKALWCVEQER
jgi:hypothetical protein